jgi:hypothetical protein
MKRYIYIPKDYFTWLIAFMILMAFYGCSTKVTFPVSKIVPAAEPVAKISKNKIGSYDINLDINNLALPERLSPPKKYYVVWIETEAKGISKLGEITNNQGLFSNRGRASFEAETKNRPTLIMVTAENDLDVTYPGSQIILKSRPFEVN